ncbi:hypothetical protein JL722_9287 [Aureococcus anophagefferens]|nr:hypothetical protein JL722_9287 [Aureococcus anophagefferens]
MSTKDGATAEGHAEELAAMAATHETARLRSEEREQDLSRKFAEMEEQYSRQLRDQQEELEGRLADVATRWRSSARASAADNVTRAVLDMIHGRLRTAWRTWTSRVKTASVAEIKEQHAMEMAALRDATRVEAANERTRRVIRRWMHRLLGEGWDAWTRHFRDACERQVVREKLPQSLFTIVSTFVFHRLARAFRKWIDVMFYAHVCTRRAVERLFYSTRAWKYRQGVSRAFSLWFRHVVSTQVMHELIELSRGHLRGLRARILRRVRSVLVGYRRHTARTFVHWLHFSLWCSTRPPQSFGARTPRLATPGVRPGYGRGLVLT